MKSKTLIIATILIAFMIIQFISYRLAFLQVNQPEKGENYKTLFNIGEKIIVKRELSADVKKYVNVRYLNFEDKFEFNKAASTSNYHTYNTYSETNQYTVVASFKVGLATTYYDKLSEEYQNKVLLKEHGIENNFDVVDYLQKHYKDEVNIFSSNNDITMRKLMNDYANNDMTKGTIRSIEGDLTGFMIVADDESKIEVNLKDEDKYYYFEFNSNNNSKYFTEDYVINFLNYVVIE